MRLRLVGICSEETTSFEPLIRRKGARSFPYLKREARGAVNSSAVETRWLTLFSAGQNRREQKSEVLSRVQRAA